MNTDTVWIDKDYNTYSVEQISDRYLKNILRFICNGGGHVGMMNEQQIKTLFDEAEKRGIKHPYRLHSAIDAYHTKGILDEVIYFTIHE